MYRKRYRRIIWFFARVISSIIFWDLFLPRIGLKKLSARGRAERMGDSAIRFRNLAIQMGGVLIKVGQFLSTRVDVLPKEITSELAGLQDEVPPVPYKAIQSVIEQEFGTKILDVYAEFDENPLAAASLGQVHRAVLILSDEQSTKENRGNGHLPSDIAQNVVVKVQRPDIGNIITTDLQALKVVGSWLDKYKPIRRRANVPALLEEFSRILYEEIDYLAEGKNAENFAANFAGDPGIRVPKVYWSHTTIRILTLEDVYAIKISDYSAISTARISRSEVASRLLNTYMKQIFEDGFFHADPHPGNLFVEPELSKISVGRLVTAPQSIPNLVSKSGGGNGKDGSLIADWQLTFVDFGMVGHVPDSLRIGLRELLIGVGTRDSARVVRAYQDMGILLPEADLVMLERAETRIFERYWGMSMNELKNLNTQDFIEFANEFRDLVYDLPFQVPQDLIFLVRCVSILSGICTGLDPELNIFNIVVPYAQKLVSDEASTHRKDLLSEIESIARSWLRTPFKIDMLLTKIEKGQITTSDPGVANQVRRLESAIRSIGIVLIFASFLFGGIQFFDHEEYLIAGILFVGSGLSLLWFIWKSMISA